MSQKLTEMLLEAGYNSDSGAVHVAYAESVLTSAREKWQDGNMVFVPVSQQRNDPMYNLWKKDLAEDEQEAGLQLGEPAMTARNGTELDGAVKAYQSLEKTCLVVPKRNFFPQLSSAKIVHELYLVD